MRASTTSGKTKSNIKLRQKRAFDAQAFLDSAGVARKVKEFKRAELVYSQGDAAESVMYLQKGGVKLSVVSEVGKEAVVAILGRGDFFGEGCLAGQSIRMGTATAITPSTVLDIEKSEMFKVLMSSTHSPTGSSLSCWRGTSESRRTWSISYSTRARSGSLALFCCLPVTARKTSPTEYSPKYRKKCWRR